MEVNIRSINPLIKVVSKKISRGLLRKLVTRHRFNGVKRLALSYWFSTEQEIEKCALITYIFQLSGRNERYKN